MPETADSWNDKHPPGTWVTYYRVPGDPESAQQTCTRSAAWTTPQGHHVVALVGPAGAVRLDAIEVRADPNLIAAERTTTPLHIEMEDDDAKGAPGAPERTTMRAGAAKGLLDFGDE